LKTPIVVSKKLDCRGQFEPLPMLALRTALHTRPEGHIIELVSDDPAAPNDFAAWCKFTGHELVDTYSKEKDFSFFIRRKMTHRKNKLR
jgi:TusA-related sulfurtransferase